MGCVVAAFILAFVAWFWYHDGVFSKVWVVTHQKPAFWWAIGFFSLVYPLWRRLKNPRGFTWGEGASQAGIMPIVGILVCSLFFYLFTDLRDQEFMNAYVKKAVYEESWTGWESHPDKCDSEGKNCRPVPDTCSAHHSPSWTVLHSINSHGSPRTTGINAEVYRNYVRYFGNETIESHGHAGQCSIGDGKTFASTFKGGREERIPSALSHEFANYVKASKQTIRRHKANTAQFRNYLTAYPSIKSGQYGPIEVDRVIAAKVQLPQGWAKSVDHELDLALTDLGEKRQVNILVYVVGTSDQAFIHALKTCWVGGKKNDVIVVIGSANGHDIDWVDASMAWTKNELFKVELRDRVQDLKTLDGNAEALAKAIVDQIQQPGERGFVRQPMEEFEYMAAEVDIPFHIWGAILGTMWAFGWMIAWAFENNDSTDHSAPRQERTLGDLFRMGWDLIRNTANRNQQSESTEPDGVEDDDIDDWRK